MPGHTKSPYWAAVDFESEEECQNQRVYVDPWDSDAFKSTQKDISDSSQDQVCSSAGEPVTGSFYYVPTKTCEPECPKPQKRTVFADEVQEYPVYRRRVSRRVMPDYDVPIYNCHKPMHERRRSVYIDEPTYAPHPMLYESIYAPVPMHPPGYMHPRTRASHQHPDYVSTRYGAQRRHSRLADTYEPLIYEAMPREYEDWARPLPKATPDNFHLSKYGHLRIDYSCSWNSLDRIIRNNN